MEKRRLKLSFLAIIVWGSITNVCLGKLQKIRTTCEDYARNVYKYSQEESINLDKREMSGIWTSSSCEAYHGPQFILRKYVIGLDGKWSADYYHYKDGWCSEPIFTVSMKGVYKIGDKSALGGHKGEFAAKSFLLIPHDEKTFIELVEVATRHCPRANLPTLKRGKDGKLIAPKLTNYTMRKDIYRNSFCRKKFGIHLYTHKVLRVLRDKTTGNINDKLYFGETPTRQTRRNFVPSAYHFPLSRSGSDCKVCRKLESAAANEVIRLSGSKKEWRIEDEWTSPTCQAVSGTFMSRFLKFSRPNRRGKRSWNLVYYFFLDSACKVLSYKISARGTYTDPKKSSKIAGAYEVAFNLTDTEITPYEMLIVELLQAEPEGTCGVTSKWHAGYMQSVKSTNGCRMFRISIPSIEYDVLKAMRSDDGEIDLFTGQSSTDNIVPNTPDKRPTSFQLPLRRCSDLVTGVEEKRKATSRPPKTRKIGIHIPKFTIPKDFFIKTKPRRDTKPDSVKRDNTVKKLQIDVSGYSTGVSLFMKGNLAITILCALVCFFLI